MSKKTKSPSTPKSVKVPKDESDTLEDFEDVLEEDLENGEDEGAESKSSNADSEADASDDTSEQDDDKPKRTKKEIILGEVKFFAGLFAFLLVFYTTIFGHFKIPSESMQPALEVGDHLYVSKFAYGYSKHSIPLGLHKLPFLPEGKIFSKVPKRGDVAVFRNPRSGVVTIKRVLGLPGDEIWVSKGRFYLNGEIIDREPIDNFLYREHLGNVVGVDAYSEQWPGEDRPHIIYEQTDQGPLDNPGTFIVPQDRLFFLGDNRDNSVDSRASNGAGFVPLDHLIGRADLMMFSFKRCKKEEGLRCPPTRFLKRL